MPTTAGRKRASKGKERQNRFRKVMFSINTIWRKVAHSTVWMGVAMLVVLFLSRSYSHGAEPVESRERLSAVPVVNASITSGPRNVFEISSCSVKEVADSQPYSYSSAIHKALMGVWEKQGLNSQIEVSGDSPEKTKSVYQNPKHDHHDEQEIEQSKQGTDIMSVKLAIGYYCTPGGRE